MNEETQAWAEKEADDYTRWFKCMIGPMLRGAILYGIERGIERAEAEAVEECEQCMTETDRNFAEAERETAKDAKCDCDLRKTCSQVVKGLDGWYK